MMPSSHLIFCRSLLLPPTPPSIRVFSNESTLCMRWPKYWSFSFSISPSNKYSGLISFRNNWLGHLFSIQFTSVQLLSHLQLFCNYIDCRPPGSSVPWTTRRSNQSILKETSPEYSLEGLMLKLKRQYFGHLMQRVDSLEKTLMLGGIGGRRRRDKRG